MFLPMRIGIDWGGTKLEVIALDEQGKTLIRERAATPQNDYESCLRAVRDLVLMAEHQTGQSGSVGIGIPGTISPATGLVKNANSVWLNGKPLLEDMQKLLSRRVRIQNDANCFAVSEAADGAGAKAHVVAGVILGTGCGCGIAIDGKAYTGKNAIAGEFGHTPLAPVTDDENPGPDCWCGRKGCLETWISGSGFQRDFARRSGDSEIKSAQEILELDDPISREAFVAWQDRLARGLAMFVNILDPDVIVLGGGMSNIDEVYTDIGSAVKPYVFTDHFVTPVIKARHGDSSGVRGAAWLWDKT